MKKTLHALNKMPILDKIFYFLLIILILCIIPLLHMGFYSHPVGDDYTYGMNAHFSWEQTGSLIEVLKAAITTSKEFWHSYQGPFASAFFMALQPAVISEQLYAATPFIMLFMLVFSTSAFLYVLLVKYLHTKPIYCKITTCVLLLFCIELLEAPSEAFFWYCGAVHYIFMHSCMLLLITVLLLAFQNSRLKVFYLFASLPLAICCGGANFVTALTTIILFCCAVCTLLLLRKKRELIILMPSFLMNIISFFINIAAPGNIVREADQLAGLPPVQAIYYAFQYCLNYIGKWTNIYILLGILFLIPIIWKAAASSQVTLRLPGLFTLFSFCLLSSMFAPSTYALGLVVIYGRSLNIIMQTYYLLLILNLYYWFRWLHQCLESSRRRWLTAVLSHHRAYRSVHGGFNS